MFYIGKNFRIIFFKNHWDQKKKKKGQRMRAYNAAQIPRYETQDTVNQLLFASEKISREPRRRKPLVLFSSIWRNMARSRKLIAANQFIADKSRNKVDARE
jgi:hypothetical protein